MSGDFHDLEYDLRAAIRAYLEMQREVIEHMTGTESVAQRVSDSIDEAISAIRSPLGSNIAAAMSRFRELPDDFVEPALEVFTARAMEVLLPDMAQLEDRLERIVQLSADAAPSPRAAAMLTKLVRCYLFGFDAEAVAMCRGAIDVSIKDAVHIARSKAPTSSRKPVSMSDKLEYLVAGGLLSESDRRDANEVWKRGNEVLHDDADAVLGVPDTVERCVRVVVGLFPKE